jgi:cobalt-zinc-cadmium efflux system protein
MQSDAHDHRRGPAPSDRRLVVALALSGSYMACEVVGGIAANSLALLADAGHMLSDVGALALALFASRLMRRPATSRRTYGYYRAEVLAALVNAATLLAVSAFVAIEAVKRLRAVPEVGGPLMMAVAAGGLVVNGAVLLALHRDRAQNMNLKGAWLHAASDALGSVQVLVAGAGVVLFGWHWLDPVASLAVAVLIVRSSWGLMRESVGVLFESAPTHIDVDEVLRSIRSVSGVAAVHDLHVWTIGTDLDALSAHVTSDCRRSRDDLLSEVQALLREQFGLDHSTIQVEEAPCAWEGSTV